jgi:stage II sporulation protein D
MFFLKRAIGGFAVLMIGISAVLPMFPSTPPAPQLAPERAAQLAPEPQVTLKLTATGRQVVLPMEEYVVGVVAAEMDPSFPPAALAAQAILARTYTLRHLQLGETASDDPGHFQAYNPARITDAIRQAVAPTRGMVVRYNGELVDAVYHSCSGGRTAGAAEGMGAPDRPYLRPVADPPCKQNENWTVRVSAASVSALAGHRGTVRSVEVGRTGPSGRALTVVVDGHEVSAGRFREAVGDEEMKSTLVTGLHVAGNQVIISGRGFGHGVGLSQWGAAALAQRGFTAEEIIRHYYSDVRIAAEW